MGRAGHQRRSTPDSARGSAVTGGVPSGASGPAAVGPWFMLGMGVVCGGGAMLYNAALGGAFLAACTIAGVVLLAYAGRVRRLSRWTSGAAFAGGIVFVGGPFALAAAMATARIDRVTLLWIASALGVVSYLVWRRGLRQREAEWEAARSVNEGQVLDLCGGTYDITRNFVYERDRVRDGGKVERAPPLVAPAAVVAAGLSRAGNHSVAEDIVMILAPVALVGFLPALALGYVTWRKIRVYEREIGRDIFNR